jgi:hypothetical protein
MLSFARRRDLRPEPVDLTLPSFSVSLG